jgi:hypothetical protein
MSYSNSRGDDTNSRQIKKPATSKDVKELFSKGTDAEVLAHLRGKHNDTDFVNKIFDAYKERQEYIMKKSRKFKRVIIDRYGSLSRDKLLPKAKKYQNKYNIDDDEFNYFYMLIVSDRNLVGNVNVPHTKMSHVFGHTAGVASTGRLNVPTKDIKILDEIMRAHGESSPLHSQVVIQSVLYTSCASEAIQGQFNPAKHNPYSYVHPVVAALFLPKVQYLDRHMLIANLSNIIKLKYEGHPITTQPDFQLYMQIVTDKNDLVCDIDNPLQDLSNRVNLQIRLWESVFNLRQGKFYDNKLIEFMGAIDKCRNNIFDAPDLAYVRDEGTVLRKLLGAFSLRPTVVSTSPLYDVMIANPYINPTSLTEIESIPMITIRLPFNSNQNKPINLHDFNNQVQWFIENKTLVPKTRSIIYSSNVLFFHVNRRYQSINIGRLVAPYNFTKLPMTVSSFQAINDQVVNFNHSMPIGNDDYKLHSVVVVKSKKIKQHQQLIIGCAALVVKHYNIDENIYDNTLLMYDPSDPAGFNTIASNNQPVRNSPITTLRADLQLNSPPGQSFNEIARTKGTIFMYVKNEERESVMFRY